MSKFYIATYSAHATILEKLNQGENQIDSLYIDAGGLIAPKGSAENGDFLQNYHSISSKTLHAKVILEKGEENILHLWTGNLRKTTSIAQNILMSFPLGKEQPKEIIDWMNQLNCSKAKHLIFSSDGSNITTISQKEIMWDALKEQFPKQVSELKVHVFSPWGSIDFIHNLESARFKDIYVYTRYADNNDVIWIDLWNKESHKFIAKKKVPFPHSKCIFITNRNDELIWTYIGSANCTNAAMLGDSNIEYGCFFDGKKANIQTKQIFNALKKQDWKKRDKYVNQERTDDESELEIKEKYEGEYSNINNFIKRNWAKHLESKLLEKKVQVLLRECYLKNKPYLGTFRVKGKDYKYTVRVNAIDFCFHLTISINTGNEIDCLELDIFNKLKEWTHTDKDLNELFGGIYKIILGSGGYETKTKKKSTSPKDEIPSFINVRFPLSYYSKKKNRAELKALYSMLHTADLALMEYYNRASKEKKKKLSIDENRIYGVRRQLVNIWLPMTRILLEKA